MTGGQVISWIRSSGIFEVHDVLFSLTGTGRTIYVPIKVARCYSAILKRVNPSKTIAFNWFIFLQSVYI